MSSESSRRYKVPQEIQDCTVKRVTWWGLIANILLASVKFIAGYLGHSQAVVADAVHSLSDLISDAGILIGVRYWSKPPDDNHPHGHGKIELFVTLGIGIILASVAIGLFWNAIVSLRNPKIIAPTGIALFAPLLSIIVKEILYRWTAQEGKRVNSVPLLANAWHHRTDALSSIPALLAVAVAMIDPSWIFVDSVGAIAVASLILYAAIKIASPVLFKLTDSGASPEQVESIRSKAIVVPGVESINQIRTRYLGCTKLSVEIHVAVNKALTVKDGHEIAHHVMNALLEECNEIIDVIVHIDPAENGLE